MAVGSEVASGSAAEATVVHVAGVQPWSPPGWGGGAITRQQLRDAIEAGIEAAEGISEADAARLRAVGDDARVVARGAFRCSDVNDRVYECPVALAFPDYSSQTWPWDKFALAFDAAALAALVANEYRRPTNVMEIVGVAELQGRS